MQHTLIQSVDSLIKLLDEEFAIYGEMATLLSEEGEALVAMRADRVGELTSRKETLALRIKGLDESRKLLARRLGMAVGLAHDQVKISTLCEHAPPPYGERLRVSGERLRAMVEQCRHQNEANSVAARRGLDLLGGTIQFLLAEADPAGKLYQAPKPKARGAYGPSTAGNPGFISRQA